MTISKFAMVMNINLVRKLQLRKTVENDYNVLVLHELEVLYIYGLCFKDDLASSLL